MDERDVAAIDDAKPAAADAQAQVGVLEAVDELRPEAAELQEELAAERKACAGDDVDVAHGPGDRERAALVAEGMERAHEAGAGADPAHPGVLDGLVRIEEQAADGANVRVPRLGCERVDRTSIGKGVVVQKHEVISSRDLKSLVDRGREPHIAVIGEDGHRHGCGRGVLNR